MRRPRGRRYPEIIYNNHYETVPGLAAGDVLNVTERYGHRHSDRLVLERIGDTPGADTVVVVDDPVGFSERDVLDPTARLGDWQTYSRTFSAGGETLGPAERDGPPRLTRASRFHRRVPA